MNAIPLFYRVSDDRLMDAFVTRLHQDTGEAKIKLGGHRFPGQPLVTIAFPVALALSFPRFQSAGP